MSRASEGIPADRRPSTGHQPGALAILAATALGGVIGSRLGKAPLALAAGAATLALWKPKRAMTALVDPPIPPELVLEPVTVPLPAQSQIDQWLARQIDREAQSAVVVLPLETEMAEAVDDYVPQSLLLDTSENVGTAAPVYDSYAHLTGPSSSQTKPVSSAIGAPLDLSPVQSPEVTESVPVVGAAWLLGVEPLPSLREAPASSPWPPAPEASAVYSAPVFDGAAFPDEIEVPPSVEPMVHLMPVLSPAISDPHALEPLVEAVQEIPVSLASAGEASFDPPLAAAPHDPWQIAPPTALAPEVLPSADGKVIEAEIVLRPRMLSSHAVTPRCQAVSPRFSKTSAAVGLPEIASSVGDSAASTPADRPVPREVWRSWWRGD